ncbi:hypothetical protein ACP70R_021085 [Stipagrostis hirtigluma subsp. patula]
MDDDKKRKDPDCPSTSGAAAKKARASSLEEEAKDVDSSPSTDAILLAGDDSPRADVDSTDGATLFSLDALGSEDDEAENPTSDIPDLISDIGGGDASDGAGVAPPLQIGAAGQGVGQVAVGGDDLADDGAAAGAVGVPADADAGQNVANDPDAGQDVANDADADAGQNVANDPDAGQDVANDADAGQDVANDPDAPDAAGADLPCPFCSTRPAAFRRRVSACPVCTAGPPAGDA